MTDNTIDVLPGAGIGPGANSAAPDVTAVGPRTVVYACHLARDLKIDLYKPAGDAYVWPVVVWVHGGGFFRGDRTKTPELLEAFRARSLAVASIDYRLSHEAHFPAQLHDVRTAVRHLRRNTGGLGLDPGAIGVWGASAGGTLAALTGLLGHQEVLPGEGNVTGDVAVQAVSESQRGRGPHRVSPGRDSNDFGHDRAALR